MRLILLGILLTTAARADLVGVVTLETSSLIGGLGSPYTIDLQLIDGSGSGNNNNQVVLSSFDFGGGSVDSSPVFSTGGVSTQTGPFGVTLADSSFFNEIQLPVTFGSVLSFRLDATANADSAGPDSFTFAILDSNGNEIPTTAASGFDSVLEVDFPSGNSGSIVSLAGADSSRTNIELDAPTFTPVDVAPEPGFEMAVGGIFAVLLGWSVARRGAKFRTR
jgi:hypothetical protein